MSDTPQTTESGRNTKKKSLPRTRGWCYTLNNWKMEDVIELKKLLCETHIFQSEVGASGTPHIQGMVYFKNGKTFNAVKELLPDGAHVEKMETLQGSVKYCTKEDTRDDQVRYVKQKNNLTVDSMNINAVGSVRENERPLFGTDEWKEFMQKEFTEFVKKMYE